MFTAAQRRLTTWLLCATLLALSGFGPVVRHAHGDEAIAHAPASDAEGSAVVHSTTHWHVDWFGMSLTLPDDTLPTTPTNTEVLRAWEALAPYRNVAYSAASASDAIAPVALEAHSQGMLDVRADPHCGWQPFESANSLVMAQLVVVLRI